MGNTEIFYRLRRQALDAPVAEGLTLAGLLAEDWNGDRNGLPPFDGKEGLLYAHAGRQTWSANVGGFPLDGLPPRVLERMSGVTRGYGPWTTHPDEPEVLRTNPEIVYVAHDELLEIQRAVARGADPDDEEMAAWLAPPGADEVEVWAFQTGCGRSIPVARPPPRPDPVPYWRAEAQKAERRGLVLVVLFAVGVLATVLAFVASV